MKKKLILSIILILSLAFFYLLFNYNSSSENYDPVEIRTNLYLSEFIEFELVDKLVKTNEADYSVEYIFRTKGGFDLLQTSGNNGAWSYKNDIWIFVPSQAAVGTGEFYDAVFLNQFALLYVKFSHI